MKKSTRQSPKGLDWLVFNLLSRLVLFMTSMCEDLIDLNDDNEMMEKNTLLEDSPLFHKIAHFIG